MSDVTSDQIEEDQEAIDAQIAEEPQEGFSKAMEEEGALDDADNPED